MYELTSTTGKSFSITEDDLTKIINAKPDDLIFLSEGAIVRRLVGVILPIEKDEDVVLRTPGMSKEEHLKLVEAHKEDTFRKLRPDYKANLLTKS
jgi:hypothetical protein